MVETISPRPILTDCCTTTTAAPTAEYKLNVYVGDRQTDKSTDIVIVQYLRP